MNSFSEEEGVAEILSSIFLELLTQFLSVFALSAVYLECDVLLYLHTDLLIQSIYRSSYSQILHESSRELKCSQRHICPFLITRRYENSLCKRNILITLIMISEALVHLLQNLSLHSIHW